MDVALCLILVINNLPIAIRSNWEKELLSLLMNAIAIKIYFLCLIVMHQICNIHLLF